MGIAFMLNQILMANGDRYQFAILYVLSQLLDKGILFSNLAPMRHLPFGMLCHVYNTAFDSALFAVLTYKLQNYSVRSFQNKLHTVCMSYFF